jgi:hypothetical protein
MEAYNTKNIGKELKEKIDLYVNGELDDRQIDKLWEELIWNRNALGYLKSAVNKKEIGKMSKKSKVRFKAG